MDLNQRLTGHAHYAWRMTIKSGTAHMDTWGVTVGNGETVAQAREDVRIFSAGRMGIDPALVEVAAFEIVPATR